MSIVRLEYVPISRFYLGFFGLSHLHITYQTDTEFLTAQDYWYVIEGVQEGAIFGGTLGVAGTSGRTSLSVANGGKRDQDLTDEIGTPEDRGARVLAQGSAADTLWQSFLTNAIDIDQQELPYVAYAFPFATSTTINSTSVIATLLWRAGIDISSVMPFGVAATPGDSTLIGTINADTLQGTDEFPSIVAGAGDDEVSGHNNTFWLEKLYGGVGDDTLKWSPGSDILHGGEPFLPYHADGRDTADYAGVGVVYIESNTHAVHNKTADAFARYTNGTDQLFSIERITWDASSDEVIAGEGVTLMETPVLFNMEGSPSGLGDRVSMTGTNTNLLINAINGDTMSFQTEANEGLDAGYWVQTVEAVVGSEGNDRIYAGPLVRIADGGAGDDIVDGRLATPFSGLSPEGYDIELEGGDGKDILISGAGRTLATGGDGADIFVLSAMSTADARVEFVITDADVSDRLYLPYNFFQVDRGSFDGSPLVQVSGGPFQLDDNITTSFFEWGDYGPSFDFSEFVGMITFERDGADLLVYPLQALIEEFTQDFGPGEPPGETFTSYVGESDTEVTIRVRDWSDGDLGITFPLGWDVSVFDSVDDYYDYPGMRDVLDAALSADRFLDPLELRPDPHTPLEIASLLNAPSIAQPFAFSAFSAFSAPSSFALSNTTGSDGDDILVAGAGGPFHIEAGAGNDDITGSDGGDFIDGGTGADTMRGGKGNDTYTVDNLSDSIIETDRGGFDRVISSIDYSLGDNLEHVRLIGDAVSATGNNLRNILEGNDANNILRGGGGIDTLAGNRGDDTLIGGAGSDGYVYELGDGRDVIIEDTAASDDIDELIFANGISAADLVFVRDPNKPDDLIVRLPDGGSITLRNQLSGGGIEQIIFADGTTWSQYDINEMASTATETSNVRPVANDDNFAVTARSEIFIPREALLENDFDADRDALSISRVDALVGGTAAIDGEGNIVLTPFDPNAAQPLKFNYTISDGHGGEDTATFNLTRIAALTNPDPDPDPDPTPNTAPSAVADGGFIVTSGRSLRIDPDQLLANDMDADGDALTITSVGNASGGRVRLDGTGIVVFDADTVTTATTAQFRYTIADPSGAQSNGIVTLTINALRPMPEPAPEPNPVPPAPACHMPSLNWSGDNIDFSLSAKFHIALVSTSAAPGLAPHHALNQIPHHRSGGATSDATAATPLANHHGPNLATLLDCDVASPDIDAATAGVLTIPEIL